MSKAIKALKELYVYKHKKNDVALTSRGGVSFIDIYYEQNKHMMVIVLGLVVQSLDTNNFIRILKYIR